MIDGAAGVKTCTHAHMHALRKALTKLLHGHRCNPRHTLGHLFLTNDYHDGYHDDDDDDNSDDDDELMATMTTMAMIVMMMITITMIYMSTRATRHTSC